VNRNLIRDPDHRYWLDGRELMGVSSVLNVISPFNFSDPIAMLRGTAVHMATEFFDKRTLDRETVDPAIMGYLVGWERFRQETGFSPKLGEIEVKVCDPVLGVAGTYDRFGHVGGKSILLDIKTGARHWRYDVQVAAYDYLRQHWLTENEAEQVATVYLNENGGYVYDICQMRSSALSLFIAGCAIQQARIAYGD
jgi:hypothetical protein